jgi:glyoxylase-like metal-dependent hydrolase (beta-lactamase superfamily II)
MTGSSGNVLSIELGQFRVSLICDGHYRLDGGAMFGVVPKPIWEKRMPADQQNRIRMGLNCLLVETGEEKILVEAGLGTFHDEKLRQQIALEQPATLLDGLRTLGTAPEEIGRVVLTHLNFDHAGHCTTRGDDGQFRPTFPAARYYVQKAEYDFAVAPPKRLRASYVSDSILPVMEAGQWELLEGDTVITGGVRVRQTGGHTAGHQAVYLESGGEELVFWGDLMPTSRHMDPGYGMAYDLYPMDTLRVRKELAEEAADRGLLSAWVHEPELRFGRIRRGEKYYELEAVSG